MNSSFLIVLIVLGLIVACGCLATIRHERKEFNNGVCPCCGIRLRHFDTDSQGGRGYICDQCGHHVWVSYGVVDKSFMEGKE